MKSITLILALVSLLLVTGCNRGPSPNAIGSKLTLAMHPNCSHGNGPTGIGRVTYAPVPQSGHTECRTAGDKSITCNEAFNPDTTVTLMAIPDPVLGPDGKPLTLIEKIDGCNATACQGCPPGAWTCQVKMDADKLVEAYFCGRVH